MKFSDLPFKPRPNTYLNGLRATHLFPNGYGVSIVKNQYSYGGTKGYYELAVTDKNGQLDYITPITGDVIGNLFPEDVAKSLERIDRLLLEIEALPPKE